MADAVTIQDLQNAKVDLEHVAEVANGAAATSTNRLGEVKPTLAGRMATIAGAETAAEASRAAAAADAAAVAGHKATAATDAAAAANSKTAAQQSATDAAAAVAGVTGPTVPTYAWSVQDGNDNVPIGVRLSDGTTEISAADVEELNGVKRARMRTTFYPSDAFMPADILGIFLYGDSIAEGQIDVVPRLVTDSVQPFGNLRFNTGVRSQDSAAAPTSLIPLVEQANADIVRAETAASGAANKLVELLAVENGLAFGTYGPVFFVSAPAAGGSYIANLQKGGVVYTRLMSDVTYAKSLANAVGKTFAVAAVIMIEGTNSMGQATPPATWKTLTEQLIADFNVDVKALIPGNPDVPFVALQNNNHPFYAAYINNPVFAQAGRELALMNPLYFPAASLQAGDVLRTTMAVHKLALGMRWLGALAAPAIKRLAIDRRPAENLDLELALAQGSVITASFRTDYPPIVWDARQTLMQTNFGFRVTSGAAGAGVQNNISSVSIVGPKTVKVVCAAPVAAGSRLQVGVTGRTNLRDSRGDYHRFTIEGLSYRLDNFALIADQVVQGGV